MCTFISLLPPIENHPPTFAYPALTPRHALLPRCAPFASERWRVREELFRTPYEIQSARALRSLPRKSAVPRRPFQPPAKMQPRKGFRGRPIHETHRPGQPRRRPLLGKLFASPASKFSTSSWHCLLPSNSRDHTALTQT